jgi:DNA-binding transcriptional ArsR family regulator
MNVHMALNDIPTVVPVQSLEALRALVDGQRHRIVTLLMDDAFTVKELADRLHIARTGLYYHLGILESHGLVRVTDSRLVSGIVEKRYRATARTFRIDRALLSRQASMSEIAATQVSILDAVAADLHLRILSTPPVDDADLLVSRAFLRLGTHRRRELRDRLMSVVEEYRDADADGVETQVALALFSTEEGVS